MPDSLWEELKAEAEAENLGAAEYVRRILRNRQADTQPVTTEYAPAERVKELEARIEKLESRLPDTQPTTQPNTRQDINDYRVDEPASTDLEEAIAVVDGLEWQEETRRDPEEYRETLRAVVQEIDAASGLKKSELQQRVYPDHDVGFSRDNWWSNLVWPHLKELRDVHGVVEDKGGGKYTTWHLESG